ncbi:unnamed protein product, partial [Closterium sp. Naga37s-1]
MKLAKPTNLGRWVGLAQLVGEGWGEYGGEGWGVDGGEDGDQWGRARMRGRMGTRGTGRWGDKDEGEDGDQGGGGMGGARMRGRMGTRGTGGGGWGSGGGEGRGFEGGQGQEVVGGLGEGVLAWAGVSVQVASASLVKSDQIRSSKDVIGQVVEFEAEEIEALEGGNARPHAAGLEGGNTRPQTTDISDWSGSGSGRENGGGTEAVTGGTQQEGERSWWRWDVGKGELVQREGPEGLADGQETLLWLPEIVYEDLELMDLRYFQGLHSPAPACPSFARCRTGRRQAGRVLACNGHDPLLSDPLSGNNGGASVDVSGPASVSASEADSMGTVGSVAMDASGSASAAGLGSASVDVSPLVDPSPVLTSPPPNHMKENASYDVAMAEPFAAQVFLLENVFINDRGMVFDAMYHYRYGLLCRSCPLDFGLYTGNETKVHVYSELLSLANWNGGNFYHSLLEVMPSLLYLRPFLEAKPGIPIPVKIDQ